MRVKFICGCETGEIIDRENIKTMSMVEYDEEDFITCVVHHQRRYGWRSIPNRPGLKLNDWSFKSWTPLEIEAWLLFGDEDGFDNELRNSTMEVSPNEDRRDNRDPSSLVARVGFVERFGTVFVATDEKPLYFVPRDPTELYPALDEIPRVVGRSQVLPWPEHRRFHEADMRQGLRRSAS